MAEAKDNVTTEADVTNVDKAVEVLLSLPNLENRVGNWRDVNQAIRLLQNAHRLDAEAKAERKAKA